MSLTFAPFIAALGRGQRGSRDLSGFEAEQAMGMILDGHVAPEQLGAFLMLMRVKEETGEEVAGMVRAVRQRLNLPVDFPAVDLDWGGYAGKRRQPLWWLLAARLLAVSGYRVLLHGSAGHTAGRLYAEQCCEQVGIPIATHLEQAARLLESDHIVYLALETFCESLQRLIDLRATLGLRSPAHTIARMINPAQARVSFQGIFHPGYLQIHQDAAVALGMQRMVVLRGEGGEPEVNPDVITRLHIVRDGQPVLHDCSPRFKQRHLPPESPGAVDLNAFWHGTLDDEYGEAAVLRSAALALWLLDEVDSLSAGEAKALDLWQQRLR